MPAHEHMHTHDEPGPHGGAVIEIGAKDHHAELVHDDDAHKVGVYVLAGDAITSTPVAAKTATIDVTEDGMTIQYELLAAPLPGESEGMTSYFEIESEPLTKAISGETNDKEVVAELRIQIGERPFVGYIEIEHEPANGTL